MPKADILGQVPLAAEVHGGAEPVVVGHIRAVHRQEGTALGGELPDGAQQADGGSVALGQALQRLVVDALHDAEPPSGHPVSRAIRERDMRGLGHVLGMLALQLGAGVRTDRVDDRRDADGLGDVVDVAEEHHHAREHEPERRSHGYLRDERVHLRGAPDGAQHDERVDERGDEHAEGELVEPVPQEGAQHPGRDWLLVSCRTTIVIENTSPVKEIIEVMIAESSDRAPSGPPANRNGRVNDVSSRASSPVRPSPRAAAATAHSSGSAQNRSCSQNQRLFTGGRDGEGEASQGV